MADVDVIATKLEADVGGFVSNMKAAEAVTKTVTDSMGAAAGAARKAGEAHEESASAIGMAVEGYNLAAEAVSKVVETLGEFAQTAIEAANEMDPAGAQAWSHSVNELQASFATFAGQLAKQVMPAVEELMGKFTQVFNYLARLDWGAIFQSLLDILGKTGGFIETWGEKVLDFLSYPFRELVGIVEQSLAGVMAAIGMVAQKLGSTSLGKKMGLSDFSGDALTQTANEMFAQADNFRKSFGAAAKEVGAGLSFSLDEAIAAVGAGPALQKLKKALTPGAGDGERAKTAQDRAVELTAFMQEQQAAADAFKKQQQSDQEHIASIRLAAGEQRIAATNAVNAAKAQLDLAQQKLADDKGRGDLGSLAADQAAVGDALSKLNAAGVGATAAAHEAAIAEGDFAAGVSEQAIDAEAAYDKARDAANAAEQAFASAGTGENQLAMQKADALAGRLKGEMEALRAESINAESGASKLRRQSAQEAGVITTDAQKRAADIQRAASKESADFLAKTFSSLGQHALGSVGGGALSAGMQGFAAAGPMGAAVGAGASLLESSSGFKKFADALNNIFQPLADAVGQLLEPLVPVVKSIGQALKPLIDALGAVFGAAGKVLAGVLTPLVPIIQMVAGVLADILNPLASLLDAVAPLVPIIMTVVEIINLLSMAGLAPLVVALKALQPAFALAAKAVSVIVDGIVTVWNGIIDAIAGVFKALAHALPGGMGDAMWSLYYGVENMKGQTTAQAAASADLTSTMQKLIAAGKDGTAAQLALTAAQRSAVQQQIDILRQAAVDDASQGWTYAADQASAAANQLASALYNAGNAAAPSLANAVNKLIKDTTQIGADRAKVKADAQAMYDFSSQGNTAAANAAFQQQMSDTKELLIDALQQALDQAQVAYQAGTGSADAVAAAEQALTEAQIANSVTTSNTTTTAANTKATQALTATLSNMVSGFRVGAYDQGAGGGSMATLGGKTGGGGVIIYGDIHVTDPDLGKALQKHVAKNRRGLGRG